MPCKRRIEFAGVLYHVRHRGDRREPIGRDATDRQLFLDTLGEACAKTDGQVHAPASWGTTSTSWSKRPSRSQRNGGRSVKGEN